MIAHAERPGPGGHSNHAEVGVGGLSPVPGPSVASMIPGGVLRVSRLWWLLVLLLALPVQAGSFAELPEAERQALAAFAEEWPTLAPEVQQRLRTGAARWAQMSPEQRRQAAERLARWQTMDDAERAEVRRRWQQFQSLPPEARARLRGVWQRFQQLPPEQRAELRERFARMSPAERRAFLQGMRAADATRGPRLPAELREPVQRMWQQLDPAERRALRARVEALPPPERLRWLRRLGSLPIDDVRRELRGG